MKRITLLALFFMAFCMTANADINTILLGCRLGVTSPSNAASVLHEKGYDCEVDGHKLKIKDVDFGGKIWDTAILTFINDKFAQIEFSKTFKAANPNSNQSADYRNDQYGERYDRELSKASAFYSYIVKVITTKYSENRDSDITIRSEKSTDEMTRKAKEPRNETKKISDGNIIIAIDIETFRDKAEVTLTYTYKALENQVKYKDFDDF